MTKKSIRGAIRAATLSLAAAGGGVPCGASARAADTEVKIDNFTFNPPRVDGEGRRHRDLDQ